MREYLDESQPAHCRRLSGKDLGEAAAAGVAASPPSSLARSAVKRRRPARARARSRRPSGLLRAARRAEVDRSARPAAATFGSACSHGLPGSSPAVCPPGEACAPSPRSTLPRAPPRAASPAPMPRGSQGASAVSISVRVGGCSIEVLDDLATVIIEGRHTTLTADRPFSTRGGLAVALVDLAVGRRREEAVGELYLPRSVHRLGVAVRDAAHADGYDSTRASRRPLPACPPCAELRRQRARRARVRRPPPPPFSPPASLTAARAVRHGRGGAAADFKALEGAAASARRRDPAAAGAVDACASVRAQRCTAVDPPERGSGVAARCARRAPSISARPAATSRSRAGWRRWSTPSSGAPARRAMGCGAKPMPTCAGRGEPCVVDARCAVVGGHGCNAGGQGQLCRFCSFTNAAGGSFLPCAGASWCSCRRKRKSRASARRRARGNPRQTCFYDASCGGGGDGCNAGGKGPRCRFCGSGRTRRARTPRRNTRRWRRWRGRRWWRRSTTR